ncbi:uncharacterized protein LOC143279878 [Babylonia areolata]|uniref:uncharacterized protein LOC143279878 n=1 Tax=Babylonia areolata TaxID=304850 RepID=UPI003FD0AB5D
MSENQKGGVDIRDYVKMYTNDDPTADTNGTEPPELTGIQVKFEVEDPEYDQSLVPSTVTAGLLRSFHSPQVVTSSQSAAEWTGSSSAIRSELLKIKDLNSSTTPQDVTSVIENVLKNNESVLAKNDAQGYKPQSRRGRPALDGSRSKDSVFPAVGHSLTFPTGPLTQGRVSGSGSRASLVSDHKILPTQLGQLMRPKSPTRRCAIQERDKSHFSLALMESKVGCEEGEKIFRVQEHEMVCAVSSQTKFLNKEGRLVSSVDISYYWCNFCNYSTTSKSFLMQHVMEHRFHCKYCRYQSFSRADVIHHSTHTHPGFQETAAITQYCTLLSDYLRIHNPSEVQLDQRGKRKDPPQDDGDTGYQPSGKVRRSEVSKDKVQKSYSADFDLFDVHVEELKERVGDEEGGSGASQESSGSGSSSSSSKPSSASSSSTMVLPCPPDPGPPASSLVSSLVSQPMSAVTQSSALNGGQPVITQVFSASTLPPTLAPDVPVAGNSQPVSVTTPQASPSPTPPPPPFYANSVGAGAMQQMRSNLYWSCGYCTFTSTSQSGIKEHSVLQHSGKPHRYVALIKSEGSMSTPPATSASSTDQTMESEGTTETGKAASAHVESSDRAESEEPPVLVKQEPVEAEDPSVPIRVRFPTPRNQSKDVTVLKCFHCSYSSRNLPPLRNHILNRHKGKCLVGVGGTSSRVFMCARSDCIFRSSSGQTYLSHSQECTPWLASETADVASHLKKCLEATIHVAEETQTALTSPPVSGSSSAAAAAHSQVSYDQFSCIYCQCQFTWSKKQTKRHVLQCHSTKCLVMRDVKAHRNRKRSYVFFCRWCTWEGKTKEEHDVHSLVCLPAQGQGDSQRDDILYDDGEVCLLGNGTPASCEDTGENGDRSVVLNSEEEEDLGPPDITHDEEDVDRLQFVGGESSEHIATSTGLRSSSSTAEANPPCKTFLSDGVPQLYISDPNGIDSDDSDEAQSVSAAFPKDSDREPFPQNQRGGQRKARSGTKKDGVMLLKTSYRVGRKGKHQSFSSATKYKRKPLGSVQCFLCGFETDTLRSLKLHMKSRHNQHVVFSFRSLYHSSLHLKCRFFVCPLLDCPLYRYNEADVVSHYRQCHGKYPHLYLDPDYSPAPIKFQRRANLKPQENKIIVKREKKITGRSPPPSSEPEGQYLCLYCDRYCYSNSISRMKAHHLAVHPSQPIVIRDVVAFKRKKMSRVSVCKNIHCDFSTYMGRCLEEHAATVHGSQWESDGAGQVMQCTVCGWMTCDDALVHQHLTSAHAGDNSATMVTLNPYDDQCV